MADDADGRAGFSYVKISSTGAKLASSAPSWDCVADRISGLMWEVKTNDGGLRDKRNLYTNRGDGQAGDTSEIVNQVNAAGLCGHNDWRLPTRQELIGLVDYSYCVTKEALRLRAGNTDIEATS